MRGKHYCTNARDDDVLWRVAGIGRRQGLVSYPALFAPQSVCPHVPALMDDAGQLEQDVDLERRNLAHRLGGVQQLVLGNWFRPVAAGRVQVNAFDQLHVVEQRVKCHKVGKAYPVPLGNLPVVGPGWKPKRKQPSIINVAASVRPVRTTYRDQIIPHLARQQVLLHVHHNVLKVERRDKPGAGGVLQAERLHRTLLVEVVQKLAKLDVIDHPLAVLAEVKLYERAVQFERDFSVQICLFEYIDKLTVRDRAVAVTVEQLERGFVQGVRGAEQPLERLKLGERDQPVLARVGNAGDQFDGFLKRKQTRRVRKNKEAAGGDGVAPLRKRNPQHGSEQGNTLYTRVGR